MRTAARVIGIEGLQNLPFSFGLIYALHAEAWLSRLALAAFGAVGTAVLIAATEHIKLDKPTAERPADLIVNALSFFGAEAVYLVYYVLIRANAGDQLLADGITGAVLGVLVGVAQALWVDERRITRQAVVHIGGFTLAGIVVSILLGVAAVSWPPLIASVVLCLLMTTIIVFVDYRAAIASGRLSQGRKST